MTPFVLLLAVGSIFFRKMELKNKVVMICFILFPYLFFTIAATKMPNFVNIVSPLILIVVAAFFLSSIKAINKRLTVSSYFSWAFIPPLFIFLLRPQLTKEKHNLGAETNYFAEAQNFVKSLNGSSADLYIYSDFHHYENIVHMFYHPSTAVLDIPSNKELERMVKEGVRIIVLYKSEYPDLQNAPEGIKVIRARIEDQKR